MKRDGMKIGLLVVLVAASGALFYGQYGRTPKRESQVFSADDDAQFKRDQRVHKELVKRADYIDAGS